MANYTDCMLKDPLSDPKWRKVVREAMDSGVSKEQFRSFLDEKQKNLNQKGILEHKSESIS
ncbi:anti-repressor SinI family protein [Fictibacillus enclensis]|uniref:anti-repressor SinI family protein n=1 Tax=Fictibacillus enclensis TaxID=1017270 RepID=UPI0025A03667|nr:anti-repressor SinI family protein [Fictibacillus enclensis]MDM5335682.1 anti-repressor SinI family protein [Fictibacillus enclensis]